MNMSLTFDFKWVCRFFIWGFFIISCHQWAWATYSCSIEDCEDRRFAIKEEYIYFQPFFDNDFIAAPNINEQIPFNLQPGGPGKKNKFDYAPGYRLSAFYWNPQSSCFIKNGCLRFTYLPAHQARRMSLASFLSQLVTSPASGEPDLQLSQPSGSLNFDHHLHYYAADFLSFFPIFNICRLNFSIQPGLHYAFMDYQSHVQFSTKNSAVLKRATLKEQSKTWGIGPQLGFNLNYQIYNGLFIKGEMRGGILLSRARAHFQMNPFRLADSLNDSSNTIDPRKLWKIFPFWETNIGLSISFSIDSYVLEMEIGYEYLTYPNFVNRIQFPGNSSLNTADNVFSNFDFQGPYASITFIF